MELDALLRREAALIVTGSTVSKMTFQEYWDSVHAPDGKRWRGKPHGSLQWKGTEACIDLYCVCGAQGHIDSDFLYHYKCLNCGRKYALSGYVKLIELTPEQAKFIDEGGGCAFRSDSETGQ